MNALCFGQPTPGLGMLFLSPPGFTRGYPRGQPFGLSAWYLKVAFMPDVPSDYGIGKFLYDSVCRNR
jgi:hypothetical protein